MLCQFSFENYKSFRDEATLDLFAEKIKEHEGSLIIDSYDGEAFLPVISIYGPNGGGKSTVLEAFIYLSHKVLLPIITLLSSSSLQGKTLEERRIKEFRKFNFYGKEKYHLYDRNCENFPTKFDILFRIDETEYRYQLNILHDIVVEENLYSKDITSKEPAILFERDSSDLYIGDILGDIRVGNIKPSIPMLSHLSINYDLAAIDKIVSWFLHCGILDYNDPFREKRIIVFKGEHKEDTFLKILEEMGINIAEIRTEEDSNGNITGVYTTHYLEDGSHIELPIEEESSGTRKLFGLLPFLLEHLHVGGLVIADEMDAKLHPKLLRYIIELFTNPKINKMGAQLIFTSHDMSTMKSSVFRRDEIWFSALNKTNASKLYSLVEFRKENGAKVRPDETYDKQYIEGRYGADPYLRNILDWGTL
ncbi:MAG: ATP-binding protein [Clostridiales bacterium]|jgi:AAA15 family ATPase/GTPase|nr:ATP-binding protein [Clostridiales bacterium]